MSIHQISIILSALIVLVAVPNAHGQPNLDKQGHLWAPYEEWEISNISAEGNPFDLIATAVFTHTESNAQHKTQMFYDGNATWKWRFTGTLVGEWTFFTTSNNPALDGLTGTVTIAPNRDPNAYGFMTEHTSTNHTKWARHKGNEGAIEVFTPQYVMYESNPAVFHNNDTFIENSLDIFFDTHGFNGLHLAVIGAYWFDIEAPDNRLDGNESDPDIRTFEALESLITSVHAAGGVVHIWPWGDASRDQVPEELEGGENGPLDQRLQRYIAARLGPIPGWSMGYGFDLFEWADEQQLEEWFTYMHQHLGWDHYLGGRANKLKLNQIFEGFDYSAYEWHRPTYENYIDHSQTRPEKPAFSEDRFRIRNREKDYTMEETRRGLWHSVMAGGVANIWGNLRNDDGSTAAWSNPYSHPEWIKTHARFWESRFLSNMVPCPDLSDAYCFGDATAASYVLYRENTDQIAFTLSENSTGPLYSFFIDTAKEFTELGFCLMPASGFTWDFPYVSDWAVAIGTFDQVVPIEPDECTTLPVELIRFGARSDGADVLLDWATASELNNAGFEIQLQPSGASAFRPVLFVDGHGTTDIEQTYRARLPAMDPGTYTFRLKQIDFDGTVTYSPEATLVHQISAPYTLKKAYPSPFQERTTVEIAVAVPQRLRATLYDTTGRRLAVLLDEDVAPHTVSAITVDADNLPNGLYFLRIEGTLFQATEKVLLLR